MTNRATVAAMAGAGTPLSVRLDAEALRALDVVAAGRLTQSEAIRTALIEAARRRQDLEAEAKRLAEDEADREEVRHIRASMDEISAPWPD
jgi:metal-responsive CopG/Arc/MetJ family transcriptional regulator